MSTWESYYEAINSGDFDSACNFILYDPNSRINIPLAGENSAGHVIYGEFLRVWLSYGAPDSLDFLREDIRAAIMANYENQFNNYKAQDMANNARNNTGQDQFQSAINGVMMRSAFRQLTPVYDLFEDKHNLLTAAIKMKMTSMAKTLIEKGASVNYTGLSWGTPLQHAAISGSFELVQFMVERGAQVRGTKALFKAATPEIVVFLIQNGADVNMTDAIGSTALVNAIQIKNLPVLDTLIQYGAHVNFRNMSNRTPLIIACCNDQYEIVECLLNRGAEINVVDYNGLTALDEAVKRNNPAIIQLLRSRGALSGRELMKNAPSSSSSSSCCVIS